MDFDSKPSWSFGAPNVMLHTLLKTDMETKNRALENDVPFHLGDDQLPAVGFQELVAQEIPKGTFL